MYLAVKCLPGETRIPRPSVGVAKPSVDKNIRDFIAGKTNGEALLHALYDHVLKEPVPQRLSALLKN